MDTSTGSSPDMPPPAPATSATPPPPHPPAAPGGGGGKMVAVVAGAAAAAALIGSLLGGGIVAAFDDDHDRGGGGVPCCAKPQPVMPPWEGVQPQERGGYGRPEAPSEQGQRGMGGQTDSEMPPESGQQMQDMIDKYLGEMLQEQRSGGNGAN